MHGKTPTTKGKLEARRHEAQQAWVYGFKRKKLGEDDEQKKKIFIYLHSIMEIFSIKK